MQKAIINKNAMTRPIVIVTAARVVLKIRRISAVFTSVNIFEQQIDHIGKYNSPHWKYESRKSGSDTSNDQKFSIIPRQKSCTDLIIVSYFIKLFYLLSRLLHIISCLLFHKLRCSRVIFSSFHL